MSIITKCDMCGCCTEQPNERGFEKVCFTNSSGIREFNLCPACASKIFTEILTHPKYNVIGIEVNNG